METTSNNTKLAKIGAFIRKLHWKELLGLVFLLIAFFFFRQQRRELASLGTSLKHTNIPWLLVGIAGTVVYILLQAGLYVYSFLSVGGRITWPNATELFLKRNVIAVFLPAGGITALAYLPSSIRKSQVHKQQVHQASLIYGFIGIFSVFIVAVPVLLYLSFQKTPVPGTTAGLCTIVGMLLAMIFFVRSVQKKGKFYRWAIKGRPKLEKTLTEIFAFKLIMKQFWNATLASVFIEVVGIIHLYIAMLASGVVPSIEASVTGYIVATIFLIISPFLRGMGAIELSLTFILHRYGYSTVEAVEITLLFRFFEFWLPLVAGVLSYAARGWHLFLRLLPPVLIFLLGLINIVSVLTPPVMSRLQILQGFIPVSSIEASNFLVIVIGLTLVVTAAFLIKGLRNAWLLAITLSFVSCLGHLGKALDYEEAAISLLVFIVLLITRKQYRLRSNPRLMNIGLATGLATFAAVLVFGSIGFYFIDQKHFHLNFTWKESIVFAFREFVLIGNSQLKPFTRFGHDYIFFINALGIGAWIFLLYCLVVPGRNRKARSKQDLEEATFLLNQFGDSPSDYYKISSDKLLYFAETFQGFVSYRVSGSFAVALEEPVCAEINKVALIKQFDSYCSANGLKSIYYRVDEDSFYYFSNLNKKRILLGREGILDLQTSKTDNKDHKPVRNLLSGLDAENYKIALCKAPLKNPLLQMLEQVSDNWLQTYGMKEIVFSQGRFDRNEICRHNVVTLSDPENKIVAFLNIIPDYTPEECTYGMIRKTADAPEEALDALIVRLIEYAKERKYQYLNLGMVPFAGIAKHENTAEPAVGLAYEKVRHFQNENGFYEFKEKYATRWLNKYLVYENDVDLEELPDALNKVMQPD